ncbi:GNAT family N-acetyltransferase [Streptomyces broussonetiae]|uniref:GNAT family N-acetyltransferase n=1 Tax=Streptomyces broussonetiae TaxID=2686304 RepID=A0A6I6NE96_9ACTN|nr:GNAT family N-acetyltransferase [Streptomyces broussonetiae]QHA08380.1 GNAT family N-acetyltransferase [Streptomyces broussonetiae]
MVRPALTALPGPGKGDAERALLEAVRIRAARRGCGLGRCLLEYAVSRARTRGCALVRHTGNKSRALAHHFSGAPGFVRGQAVFTQAI